MLEFLRIRHWQSHTDTILEFHPGINVIVGENNSGKTSIARALWTAVFNPMGYLKKFKRLGSSRWPIIDMVWKGHEITRSKEGYALDGRQYKAVRDTVPKAIQEVLNLTDLNFKTIREDLFFISMPQGARARLLNRVTGVDMQEVFVSYCNKQIADAREQIKTKEHLRASYKSEISVLTPVLELEPSIEQIGVLLDDIVATETKFNAIAESYNRMSELEDIIEVKDRVSEFRGVYEDTEEVWVERSELEKDIEEWSLVLLELQQLENILSRRKIVSDFDTLVNKAKDFLKLAEDLGEEVDHYREALDTIVELDQTIHVAKRKVEDLQERKRALLKDLGICPVCDSKIEKKP